MIVLLKINAADMTLADKARFTALVMSCFPDKNEIDWGRVVSVVALEVDDFVVSCLFVTIAPWSTRMKYAFELVCTTSKMRQRGYARMVMKHALQRFNPVVLHVNRGPEHDRLVGMYEKFGFFVEGQNCAETEMRFDEDGIL